MCRWFVYLSPTEHCLLEDVLVTPANSLSHQVSNHYMPGLLPHGRDKNLYDSPDKLLAARNSLLNMDGLGIAWYSHAQEDFVAGVSGLRPAMYKSISPPVNDFNFRGLCANAQSRVVMAHIRASSGAPVSQVNNHPFAFGRHTFMHNGVLSSFGDVRLEMCRLLQRDAYRNVLGGTDSEHLAALYITYLTGDPPQSTQHASTSTSSTEDLGTDFGAVKDRWQMCYTPREMCAAMHKAVMTALRLQKGMLGPDNFHPSSLNLAATDGVSLVTFRFRNHAIEQPPSLYYSTSAGTTLNRKYPGHPNRGPQGGNGLQSENGLQQAISAFKDRDSHGKHVIVASEPTTFDEGEWSLIGRNCCLMVDGEGRVSIEEIACDDALNGQTPKS